MKKFEILIVDDHNLLRKGLITMINNVNPEAYIFTEDSKGTNAVTLSKSKDFDLIILDINMPDKTGIEAATEIISSKPGQKIMFLSMHEDQFTIKKAVDAGVKGYVLKSVGPEELEKAMQTILQGGVYYDNKVSQILINQDKNEKDSVLSQREIEVLKLVAEGFSAQEVADKLFLSKRTIEGHKNRIMNKLNIKNSAGLIRYALQNYITP